ncbi:unnamed protein product, partial [Adineta steineri]
QALHLANVFLLKSYSCSSKLKVKITPAISKDQMLTQSQIKQEIQIKKNKFQQFAITVAGGNGQGHELNQLYWPRGIFVDNDKSIYIADSFNHRIVKWELNINTGQIFADGNGKENQNNQLKDPTNIGLAIDRNGFIYVSDWENHEVRRWKQGDKKGELVAGGNGEGNRLNQLNFPTNIFIDKEYSLYISDSRNNRVVKWKKDAKEGIIVACGNGEGNSLKQLDSPRGVFVDHLGQIYVTDYGNHRVMRWCDGDEEGETVVGGNGDGNQSDQLSFPTGLSFDNEENLYVVDQENHRIQKYEKI